jgi:outer membrane protein OmpA-like peptidoglycan-associated protein
MAEGSVLPVLRLMIMKTKNVLLSVAILLSVGCGKKLVANTANFVVDKTSPRLELKNGTTVLFATGSDQILPESDPLIADIANYMKQVSWTKIRVEGHTDSAGDDGSNLELSKKRAESVRQALVAKGIGDARVTSEGCGEKAPIGDNGSEDGKQQNRRVEFVFTKKKLFGNTGAESCKAYQPKK